jgi:hypothetical protein
MSGNDSFIFMVIGRGFYFFSNGGQVGNSLVGSTRDISLIPAQTP